MDDASNLAAVAAFVWGALWGSFTNVVVHRLPLGISLARPPSRCPACETPIRPWHNVPILGWCWLRGRCAACRASIPARYPMVELACALLAVAVYAHLVPPSLDLAALAAAALVFFFVLALVAITFIDLDYRIIPHSLTIPLIVAGPLVATFAEPHTGVSWLDGSLGALLGGGLIFLVIEIYFRVRKVEGMGGGDAMLLAALGAWLGYEAVLFLLFASSVQGTLAAVLLYLTGRSFPPPLPWPGEEPEPPPRDPSREGAAPDLGLGKMELPFGPFLVLAGLEWLFFHEPIQRAIDALTSF